VLLGAVGFVLLLVCANVASLTLARGSARRREMAVRTALGAGRRRLVRQLLTESVLLSVIGGTIGVLLAVWGIRGIGAMLAAFPIPVPGDAIFGGRVLLVAVVVSVLAGVLVGLLPALDASRGEIATSLRAESGTSTGGGSRHRLQRILVGAEVALALVLLVGGGLLINSFVRLQRVDAGFDARNVLTMRLTLPRERYSSEAIGGFFERLSERIAAVPGVRSVAYGSQFPPGVFERRPIVIDGQVPVREEDIPTAYRTLASHGYFETLGIPLVQGRTFEDRDREGALPVAVINEAAARRYFPGENPVGRRLRTSMDTEGPALEIVGVVGATRNRGLDRPAEPEVFGSARQFVGVNNQLFLLVRTTVPPHDVLPIIRQEVAALDPQQPVYAVQTIEQAFAAATAPRRIATVALTAFAGFALLLAAIGIYGVVAHAVNARTREIGVRMALGARGRQVLAMIVRQAMLPVAVGAVVGLAGAVAVGRLMGGLLYEIEGADPLTIVVVAAVLAGVALVASWLPARRASRLDPVYAMRE
jgi:putative ABC transport system permease protein